MEVAVDIYSIAREFGAKIHFVPFRNIDGIVMNYKGENHIGIRSDVDVVTRSWVVAHELGHIVDGTIWFARSLITERRADSIARRHLIPERDLRKAVEDYGAESPVLARMFWVPEKEMEHRLREVFLTGSA